MSGSLPLRPLSTISLGVSIRWSHFPCEGKRPIEANKSGAGQQRLGCHAPALALDHGPQVKLIVCNRTELNVSGFGRLNYKAACERDQRSGAKPRARPQDYLRS